MTDEDLSNYIRQHADCERIAAMRCILCGQSPSPEYFAAVDGRTENGETYVGNVLYYRLCTPCKEKGEAAHISAEWKVGALKALRDN